MEIKYEAVFGDQSLFDDAPEDCFCVAKNVYDDCVFYREVDRCLFWFDCGRWKPLQFMSCTPIAMRHIIKTPVWTVADHKAGKLPPVGCRVYVPMMHEEQNVIYSSEKIIVSISDNEGAVTRTEVGSIDRIKPIESPEEKAQRLEDEFINYVLHHEKSQINSSEELVAAKRAIKLAYKLQLSGELPMPGKE